MALDTFMCSRCQEEHPINFRAQSGWKEVGYEMDSMDDGDSLEDVFYEICFNCDDSAVAGIVVSVSEEEVDDDLPF